VKLSRALVVALLVASVVGAGVGLLVAALTAREYEAQTLLATHPEAAGGAFPVVGPAPEIARALESDAQLIRIAPVVQNALRELPGGTDDGVREQVDAAPVRGTFMLKVTGREDGAERAAAIANAFADALVEYRRNWDAARLKRAGDAVTVRLESLDNDSPGTREQRRLLERRLADIVTQASFGEPPLEVVDGATAAGAARTWPWARYGAIGAAAGLALAILLLALRRGISSKRIPARELASVHDHPLLGTLPRHGSLRTPLIDDTHPVDVSAAVERLTEHLDRRRQEGTRSVLITSAARFEGRSTVALILARALARRGLHVLVVEADLAHPKLADATGRPSKPGLVALAAGTAQPDEVIHNLTDTRTERGGVFVLHAGDRVTHPEHVLATPALHRRLQSLRKEFDAILIDAPARFLGDELASSVDGILVVGRPGMASRDSVTTFASQLRVTHDGAVMGLVLNALRPRARSR